MRRGGRKLVLLGWGETVFKKALWISHYTKDITVLTTGHGGTEGANPRLAARLSDLGIRVLDSRVAEIEPNGEELGTVILEDGTRIEGVYRGYSTMGLQANSSVAEAMGVKLDNEGFIIVDSSQRTNVRGVYAAGDVVSGQIGQIVVAVGNAATATTDIHSKLLIADGVFNGH